MFNAYKGAPFIRLLIPFFTGIVLTVQYQIAIDASVYFVVLIGLVLLFFHFARVLTSNYSLRWIYGAVVWIFLFFAGVNYVLGIKSLHKNKLPVNEQINVIANVIESSVEKNRSYQVLLKILAYEKNSEWNRIKEKAIIYFQKDSFSGCLRVGDQIILKTSFKKILNNGNPNEFDYAKYMSDQFIYKQAFLKTEDWKIIARNKGNWVLLQSRNIRSVCLKAFKEIGIKGDELAIVSAMILGDRYYLNDEVKQQYANSGAIHLLAISGLHVGVIFLLLNKLLFFLRRRKAAQIAKAIILIIILWIYAFITGLSPSVVRAVVMFSFLVIGMSLKRKLNIYNTLAASAFLMIIVNPMIVSKVGFQLSYLAVLSIVFFYPRIYSLIQTKFWLIDKVWSLFVLSVAAQIGTFPITLFYFHQFSSYFFITNILIIPLAGVVIYSGFFILLFSFVPSVAYYLSIVLVYVIRLLNTIISFVSGLPYSVFTGIFLDKVGMLIIYLLIFLIAMYCVSRKRVYVFSGVICIIIFLVISNFNAYRNSIQKKFTVYNIKGHTAIECIDRKNNVFIGDDKLINNKKKINYFMVNNWISLQINKSEYLKKTEIEYLSNNCDFYKNGNFIKFYNKRIYLLNNGLLKNFSPRKKFNIDILVISGDIKQNILQIMTFFQMNQVIIDSSVPYWLKTIYLRECGTNKLPCYSVEDEGAFILEL